MALNIRREYPPNIDAIAAVLPEARSGTAIFCYGATIFNPGGGRITGPLLAHEQVHSERQGETREEIEAWWDRYLTDAGFRFAEELLAHQAEFAAFCRIQTGKGRRIAFLDMVAKRLAGPLYGGHVYSFDAAKQAIRDGASL